MLEKVNMRLQYIWIYVSSINFAKHPNKQTLEHKNTFQDGRRWWYYY